MCKLYNSKRYGVIGTVCVAAVDTTMPYLLKCRYTHIRAFPLPFKQLLLQNKLAIPA